MHKDQTSQKTIWAIFNNFFRAFRTRKYFFEKFGQI